MRPSTRPRSGRPTASLSARRPGTVNDPGDRDTIVDDEPGGFQGCSGGQGSRPRPSRAITGSPGASRPGATAAHDGHGVVAPGHEQRFFVGPQCHRPRDDVQGRSPREGVRSGAASACPTRRSRWSRPTQTRRQRPVYLQRRGRPVPTKQGRGRDDRHQRCPSRCGWPTPPSAAGRRSGSGRAGCTGTRGGHIHLPRGGNPALAPAKRRSTGADCHFLTAS